jgi:NTE family protein
VNLQRLALLVLCFTLSACALTKNTFDEKDAPVALATVSKMQPPPKIALVLGSGGPRGFAHIGVLKALESVGIVPDLVVGTSVGAIIGAIWASGVPAEQIEKKSLIGGPAHLLDVSLFADRGWVHGQRIQDVVNTQVGDRMLEELAKPMLVVAAQRNTKQMVVFARGNTGVAVRASSAVSGLISPVNIRGVDYEDGDSAMPLAVSVARAAGAQFVIAVDVSAYPNSAPSRVSVEWLERDARRWVKVQEQAQQADFLIHPDLGYFASARTEYFNFCIKTGEETAQQRMPELLRLLPK